MEKRRYLRLPIQRGMEFITCLLCMFIISIDNFDISGLKIIVMLMISIFALVSILRRYGRY